MERHWYELGSGAAAWFAAPAQAAGAALVRRIANDVAGAELRASGVRVRVASPDSAAAVSAAARELGLEADPAALQAVRLVIDSLDVAAIEPFWTALKYRRHGDELADPMGREPALSLRSMDSARPLRNRFHFDIGLPHAAAVVDAVKAAGAIEAEHATAADPDGNEVCLPGFAAALLGDDPDLADWRAIGSAMVCYRTASFGQGADLAAAAADVADAFGKPLLIDLRPDGVVIDSGKDQQENEDFEVDKDFADLARRIQAAARGLGLTADPAPLHYIQIAIDAVDVPAAQAFWMAVLGYRQDTRFTQDIYDPRRLGPVFWFQEMDASDQARRAQRNRTHVELSVAADHAQSRIDAALATGGRIVREQPGRWTLADPEGNEIDLIGGNQFS
ncbi:MAG TPA: VOC family protein [Mycobacteriales bacterium]|nr:VOC family protein [Mycobacteriales bacterium]